MELDEKEALQALEDWSGREEGRRERGRKGEESEEEIRKEETS